MPKISLIVPIYNTGKFISRCIESILAQTFTDFELILINDGSTDNSEQICNEYKLKDSRIKYIYKSNGGISDARNLGIKVSKGNYIGFIDSDDTINKDMLKILYEMCINYNCEISSCRAILIKDDKLSNINYSNNISIVTNKEAIKLTYNGGLSGYSVWNKLFEKKLFNDIKFPVGRIYEDASVLYKLYMKSHSISFIDCGLYNYIYREGSITRSNFSVKRFDIVDMFNEKYHYMSSNYPEMSNKIKSMYYESLRNIIVDIVNEGSYIKNYKYIKKSSKLVRKELKFILNNELINKKHKILALVIAYMPSISLVYYKNRREFI